MKSNVTYSNQMDVLANQSFSKIYLLKNWILSKQNFFKFKRDVFLGNNNK